MVPLIRIIIIQINNFIEKPIKGAYCQSSGKQQNKVEQRC